MDNIKEIWELSFFKGAVSLVRLVLSPKIVINLTKIHEKLYCKGKPYRLRTQRQTDILLLLKRIISFLKRIGVSIFCLHIKFATISKFRSIICG